MTVISLRVYLELVDAYSIVGGVDPCRSGASFRFALSVEALDELPLLLAICFQALTSTRPLTSSRLLVHRIIICPTAN